MSVVYGALLPHPPILVPEVGGDRLDPILETQSSVRRLCRQVAAARPTRLVLITPHGPFHRGALTFLMGEQARGDLARFGASGVKVEQPLDRTLSERLAACLEEAGFSVVRLESLPKLDHGLVVPLYYVREALGPVPAVIVSSTDWSARDHFLAARRLVDNLPGRTVVLASGDLSHKLTADGPYGFDPQGPEFDRRVVEALQHSDSEAILDLPDRLVERAAVCGHRPLGFLLGSLPDASPVELFSYQGPFGVGYAVAGMRPALSLAEECLELAQGAVETEVIEGRRLDTPVPLSGALSEPRATFVTLRQRGQLRGCIGTLTPRRPTLADELIENARSACTRDPRFDPVTPAELDSLSYSVYLLYPPEPIADEAELDPACFGVVVRSGERTGVLLPGIPSITTVAQQLAAARRKAGLQPTEPITLERFRVDRFGAED